MPSPTDKQGEAKRNDKTKERYERRNAERNAGRDAGRDAKRDAGRHGTRRKGETPSETQGGTAYRKTKRDERRAERNGAYIFNTPGEVPKELSAFSTVRQYNTQDRRTIASHGNIHNMNTNPTGSLISNWCSVCWHKKNGGGNISRPLVSFCCCPPVSRSYRPCSEWLRCCR